MPLSARALLRALSRRPRILTPLFPASLLSPGSLEVERRVIGPEQDVLGSNEVVAESARFLAS